MIQDAFGATVASGTWTATQMLGFVNYGSGAVQGPRQTSTAVRHR